MLTITSFAGNNKYNGGNISRNIPSETFIQIYDKMFVYPDNYKIISINNKDITDEFKCLYLNEKNILSAWQYVYDNVSGITLISNDLMPLADSNTSQEAIYDILRCQNSGAAFEICFYVEFTYEVNSNNKIVRSSYPQISEWIVNPFDESEFKYSLSVKKNSYSINTSQNTITYTYNYQMNCTVLTTDGLYYKYNFPVMYHTFSRSV
jgi:hypothetical protein